MHVPDCPSSLGHPVYDSAELLLCKMLGAGKGSRATRLIVTQVILCLVSPLRYLFTHMYTGIDFSIHGESKVLAQNGGRGGEFHNQGNFGVDGYQN